MGCLSAIVVFLCLRRFQRYVICLGCLDSWCTYQVHHIKKTAANLRCEFRAEFQRIPENFLFQTLFRPKFFWFRFRFWFWLELLFLPNISLSEQCSHQIFADFFHQNTPPAISAGVVIARAKRTSTGMMAENLHVASRCPFGGSSGAERQKKYVTTINELVLE